MRLVTAIRRDSSEEARKPAPRTSTELGRKMKDVRKSDARSGALCNADSVQGDDLALPHAERIRKWGHRKYVGGDDAEAWYGIGKRQYHFLVAQGLASHHVFLDVACGSLRLGQYLIPMLDKGNYFGLEAERSLVEAGIEQEMIFDLVRKKEPTFMFGYDFDLSHCKGYDFAMAQSLFTHLTPEDIGRCLASVSRVAKEGSKFFFTFFEGDEARNPQHASHPNKGWFYRFSTLKEAAEANGFRCDYIGDWGHERNQMMAVATKA